MEYPAEVRLEVYDAIIEYAASGTLRELKPLAKMAFSFIKKEIDYNNEKYEETVTKRSEAGKKGMSSRYKNHSGVTNLTNVTSDNNANKTNTCYQGVTNLTNVTDNDNVYDNVSLEGEKIEDPPAPDHKEMSLPECKEELRADQSWTETVCHNTRSSGHSGFATQDFTRYLDLFFAKLENEGVKTKSAADAKAHFARWLNIELEKQKRNGNQNRNAHTSKQEANDHALHALQERIGRRSSGLQDELPKPF